MHELNSHVLAGGGKIGIVAHYRLLDCMFSKDEVVLSTTQLKKGRGFANCEIFGLPEDYLDEVKAPEGGEGKEEEPAAKRPKSN